MKLERISAVLRPRSDSEAIDLGLTMVRHHAAAIYRSLLIAVIPLWGVLAALMPESPHAMLLVAWWLKPVYDQVVILYLGRVLFDDPPNLREQLREWRQKLGRPFWHTLAWGRFSGSRSFLMPVTLLEHSKGKSRKERLRLLANHSGSSAFGFMSLFVFFELALVAGLIAGCRSWLPGDFQEWLQYSFENIRGGITPPLALLWSLTILYLIVFFVLEPFYAGGGFGLYVNARTHLEGWDVDLVFRQMDERLRHLGEQPVRMDPSTPPAIPCEGATPPPLLSAEPPVPETSAGARFRVPPQSARLGIMVLFLGGVGMPLLPYPVRAQSRDEAKSVIQEVLAHPDFTEHVKKHRVWQPDVTAPPPPPPKSPPSRWDWSRFSFLKDLWNALFAGDWKQVTMRLLFCAGLALLFLWLGRWLYRNWQPQRWRGKISIPRQGPRVVMEMDLNPASLPANLAAEAWSAWEKGEALASVRLLYRGALSWLVEHGGVPIRSSDTEGDCLAASKALAGHPNQGTFRQLTNLWVALAYGKRMPTEEEIHRLCQTWPFEMDGGKIRSHDNLAGRLTVVAVALLGCSMQTGCKGKWVDEEQQIGHLGEARRNPWLAAVRLLERFDYDVTMRRGVLDLPEDPGSTVLLLPSAAVTTKRMAERVLDWARRGGHVIYFAEGGGMFSSDWSGPGSAFLRVNPGDQLLPAALEVEVVPIPSGAGRLASLEWEGETYQVSLHERLAFQLPAAGVEIRAAARVPESGPGGAVSSSRPPAAFASLNTGRGTVTLFPDARAFRNRWIDDDDHAALLLALIQVNPVRKVVLIRSGQVSLWDMLVTHAWPVLLAAGTLGLVWLWATLPRMGPIQRRSGRKDRNFSSHLSEAGAYLWKQKLADSLLEPGRQAVKQAALAAGISPSHADYANRLAALVPLSPARVQQILQEPVAGDSHAFVRMMMDLQTLWLALQPMRRLTADGR